MIINADDFGYSQSVNNAVCECFERKLINRTTVMVNMPYAEEAKKLAFSKGFADKVGLHINLTEGAALSEECAKSELCDENGYFKGTFHIPFKSRIILPRKIRKAIYAETEAQMKKYIEMGFTLMHADSHNYTHSYLSVYTQVRKLMKKYGFTSSRISANLSAQPFSFAVGVYKSLFNFMICRLRVNGKKISTTKYFGSAEDFEALPNWREIKFDTELMTHPDFVGGILTDNTLPNPHPFNDEQWLESHEIHLEDVSHKKRRLLICFIQAHIGGAMTSLVNFVNSINTEKYDVDLMFYENGEERFGIKKEINIIPQGKQHKSNDLSNIIKKAVSMPYIYANLKGMYFKKIKHNKKRALQIMSKQGSRYSRSISKHYDAAIAYELSWAMNYMIKKVKAEKKLIWFHNDFENAGFSFKVDRASFEKADGLVFVSEQCRQRFAKSYPSCAEKTYFMPNIMTEEYMKNRAEEEISFPCAVDEKSKIFLSVSRVNFDEKGLDRAAKVFYRLKSDGLLNDIKWIVVGKGRDLDAFKKLVKEYGLEEIVYTVGMKKNPVPYMKKSDILFLPSRHEGKPMVVTEGFIMGLVPIVTSYTSAHEQIRDCIDGLIFENSEDGLYLGLKKFLENTAVFEQLKKNVDSTKYGNEKDIAVFDKILDGCFECGGDDDLRKM